MPSLHRILAIETSLRPGSIAVLECDRLVAERELPSARRTTQCLIPSIDDLTRSLGWTIGGIQIVAVSQGPGSFTGIRVGLTTAMTLAYATGAKIVAVNTLDCIADQAPKGLQRLNVVIDAQRGDLCAGTYVRRENCGLERWKSWRIVSQDEWLAELSPGEAVTGPGLAKLSCDLAEQVEAVDQTCWEPRAATIGRLAWSRYESGLDDDFWKLKPIYFRHSAAEEKLAGK